MQKNFKQIAQGQKPNCTDFKIFERLKLKSIAATFHVVGKKIGPWSDI